MRKWLQVGFFIFGVSLLPIRAFAVNDLLGVFHDALGNDPTFKAAQSLYLANQENLPIARSALLPSVILTGLTERQYVRQKLSPFFTIRTINPPEDFYNTSNIYSLNITQPLFNYSSWYAMRGASYQVKQAEATFAASAQDLMLRTSQAYFAVMQASDTLRYTLAQKKAIGEQLRQAQQQYEVGLIAITGVSEAQANYDAIVASEIAGRNNLAIAMEQLRAITSHRYYQLMGVSGNLPLVKPNPANIDRWVYTAECQNYTLRAAIENTNYVQQTIEVNRGGHFPVINAVGSYTYDGESNAAVTGYSVQQTTAAGLSLNFPIYQGGLVSAQTQQASYLYQQAISNMEFTHRNVVAQAREAYLGVITGINKIVADRQAILSAQIALRATRAGYEAGTRTILDVLTSLSSLYQAQITYSTDLYTYLTNILTLKEAAGTLSPSDLVEMNSWLREPVNIGSKIANLDKYSLVNNLKMRKKTAGLSPIAAASISPVVSSKKSYSQSRMDDRDENSLKLKKETTLPLSKQEKQKVAEIKQKVAETKKPSSQIPSTTVSGNYYTIELFDTRFEQHAKKFIRDHHIEQQATYFKTQNAKSEDRYQVVYGKYPSLKAAAADVKKLPAALKKLNPWIKKM